MEAKSRTPNFRVSVAPHPSSVLFPIPVGTLHQRTSTAAATGESALFDEMGVLLCTQAFKRSYRFASDSFCQDGGENSPAMLPVANSANRVSFCQIGDWLQCGDTWSGGSVTRFDRKSGAIAEKADGAIARQYKSTPGSATVTVLCWLLCYNCGGECTRDGSDAFSPRNRSQRWG